MGLFPITTQIVDGSGSGRLSIGGSDLADLAAEYGTPLYLYDQATMDASLAAYQAAFAVSYPGKWGITYASKAFLCTAMAQWVEARGLWLDCTGQGELRVAAEARVSRQRTLVHGVNKSRADLEASLAQAGTLVVDNLDELAQLGQLAKNRRLLPNLWLRLRPGVAVDTHAHRQTGPEDSKFGMSSQEAADAVRLCRRLGLPLTGLHLHQGSHFHDPAPIGPALDRMLDLMAALRAAEEWSPEAISPGGGWAVAYHEDELPQPPIDQYVSFIARHLVAGCRSRGLELPAVYVEPGRSLVARAGVALYRIGTTKQSAGRRWLLMDGGLADNPRPALYGARYSALPVKEPLRPSAGSAWLAGPFCETGDVLIENLPMPDLRPGELVAVPVSGAYQLSMGSNYNSARKPAVLWLQDGQVYLIQGRETLDDLVRRDHSLPQI
jgi:diaminopimelate decarboxylase